MKTMISSWNGCVTGCITERLRFVKNKKVRTRCSSNYWSSSEYNTTNCWNLNFNNGNVNNNNRYNTNYVRAVAALDDDWKISWFNAYLDCIKHKLSSHDCCTFRMLRMDDVWTLMADVHAFHYSPGVSKTFCVDKPKVREIFAADFRDRIVHHWIYNELNEYIETSFLDECNISYNCRKGYGTLRCVEDLSKDIDDVVSRSGTAWILKMDIRSFFMSINRVILWKRIHDFILSNYKGKYMQYLLYVIKETLRHHPQDLCYRGGNISLWNKLPSHKSMFNLPRYTGMAIGNLTSQQFANFYLFKPFDVWIEHLVSSVGGKCYRFVDDILCVVPQKNDAKDITKKIRVFMEEHNDMSMHPDKVYLQPVHHGVNFIGSVIKSHRIYISNRTVHSFKCAAKKLDELCKNIITRIKKGECLEPCYVNHMLIKHVDSVNAYIGLMSHKMSYNIRYDVIFGMKHIWPICYVESHSLLVRVKHTVRYARTPKRLSKIIH